MKDARKRDIQVGDEIVVALAAGRSPMLVFGFVTQVERERIKYRDTQRPYGSLNKSEQWLHYPERIFVINAHTPET